MTLIEGSRMFVNSKSVVCLGAPKTGVMNALLSGEALSWSLSVADIGIPQIVWRKYGTRRRHGIDFGNRWVVPLRYQPPVAWRDKFHKPYTRRGRPAGWLYMIPTQGIFRWMVCCPYKNTCGLGTCSICFLSHGFMILSLFFTVIIL